MKIKGSRDNTVPYTSIEPGDCFALTHSEVAKNKFCRALRGVFMKTKMSRGRETVCVRLSDGQVDSFKETTEVVPFVVESTIKGGTLYEEL